MKVHDFETLARTLRPGIVGTAMQILGNKNDAEDVAQDVLLKLWSIRDTLKEYRSVEALTRVMARRMAINALRQRQPGEIVELPESLAQEESADDSLQRREQAQYIDFVLSTLPDSQQTLIRLRHIEGYDNSTIAAILGSNEGAVRTALSRARRRIAEVFASTLNL